MFRKGGIFNAVEMGVRFRSFCFNSCVVILHRYIKLNYVLNSLLVPKNLVRQLACSQTLQLIFFSQIIERAYENKKNRGVAQVSVSFRHRRNLIRSVGETAPKSLFQVEHGRFVHFDICVKEKPQNVSRSKVARPSIFVVTPSIFESLIRFV